MSFSKRNFGEKSGWDDVLGVYKFVKTSEFSQISKTLSRFWTFHEILLQSENP